MPTRVGHVLWCNHIFKESSHVFFPFVLKILFSCNAPRKNFVVVLQSLEMSILQRLFEYKHCWEEGVNLCWVFWRELLSSLAVHLWNIWPFQSSISASVKEQNLHYFSRTIN